MLFDDFVKKVCALDKRNVFKKPTKVDKTLPEFYSCYDPVDVEFDSKIGVIRMIPTEKLKKVTEGYSYIGLDLVFATINGDPLFLKGNTVYICTHGCDNPKLEKVANTFNVFLKTII